jgi:crossover junction endodeoxyribonuclease RuvC
MNSGILPGVIRGLGKARIRFDLAYKNRKIGSEYSKKYSFLEKLNLKEREFSRSALFKTLKFFSEPEPDEVLFWTVLKLINAEEVGGLCYPKEELKKFILEKNKTLEPEKSWEKYFANPSTDLLFEEEGMIYLNHLYRIEKTVCMYLEKFLDTKINEKFKAFKDKKLSEEQVSIVNSIFKNSISFLSGGPGTGKTTIIQAILLSGIENKMQICEFTPLQIKQSITGYGKADKRQMQKMVAMILNLKEKIKSDDAADALGVALCASQSLWMEKFKRK